MYITFKWWRGDHIDRVDQVIIIMHMTEVSVWDMMFSLNILRVNNVTILYASAPAL